MIQAKEYISKGGIDFANEVLQEALGSQKAAEIMEGVQSVIKVTGFRRLREVDPEEILDFIRKEHPQTVALILANLRPEQSAAILAKLPAQKQQDIAYRIATIQKIPPEVIEGIEVALEAQFESTIKGELTIPEGAKIMAELLNSADRAIEKSVLAELGTKDPELATEIKELMFVFEDIVTLSAKDLQRVLLEVKTEDLAIALKGTTDDLKSSVFANVSKRLAAIIQEEMDLLGPVRLQYVEEAQKRIVEAVLDLEDREEIANIGDNKKGGIIVE